MRPPSRNQRWWPSASTVPLADFPWQFAYSDDPAVAGEPRFGRAVLRPLVQCRLAAREVGERTWALVNSGCEYTLAMRWIAQAIGVKPDEDRSLLLGIGGESIRVVFAEVRLRFGPPSVGEEQWDEWDVDVGFVDHWRASWPVVLGQRGLFDRYTVTMNRYSQALALTALDDFDRRFPPLVATNEHPPPLPQR